AHAGFRKLGRPRGWGFEKYEACHDPKALSLGLIDSTMDAAGEALAIRLDHHDVDRSPGSGDAERERVRLPRFNVTQRAAS
ncbi:hypothetical protein SB759_38280, partial [Pseudomonas sp. SIMBA_059]